ncbi:putative FAD/NAD(P)-binding domain-containing protein [Seiridium unicorne]|uniref:FAD/NAD(P)-binding domain-containing protein n=1 Tax=Seiridium unicorne TaxID=138068 RepID=A0ABR2UJC3_9PEZI
MKRVVIIGSGPCGLVALKEMREAGHEAILFEKSSRLGGVFATSTVYPNLHLTISNWAMAFSDFPDPERLRYSTAQEYLRYLQLYARHFDLERYITCDAEVTSARTSNEIWHLEVHKRLKPQAISHIEADALVVATGANQVANKIPDGLADFSGRVMHSSQYDEAFKQEVAAKKLRVLVVGGGESGADISAELGELSPNITVWVRRAACVGPRYLNRVGEMQQIEANKTQDFPANGFLEAATTNRMSAAQNVYAYGFFRRILWYAPVLNRVLNSMNLDSTGSAFLMNDQATYVTKNQRMCEALQQGSIEVLVSPTISTSGRICEFRTNDHLKLHREFDVILLCSGFHAEFPWLKLKDFNADPRSWFLHCFPEGLGRCLFFVGYARPHQGGIPAMAEMLARYIALILRGDRVLPPDYTDKARCDAIAEQEYYHLSPNLRTLVDYNAFLESTARRIGCEPRLPALCILLFNLHLLGVMQIVQHFLRLPGLPVPGLQAPAFLWLATVVGFLAYDDGLLIKWWFYPNWSVWYRQRGPGASPGHLYETLNRMKLWRSTAITRGFVLLIFWIVPTYYLQRLLSVLLFVPHIILYMLGLSFPKAWGGLLRPKLFVLHSNPWRFSDLFMP